MLLIVLSASNAWAAGRTTLNDLSSLIEWFKKFTVTFDGIAAEEERAQFLRVVDKLRTSIYELEADSRLFVAAIPKELPSAQRRKELHNKIEGLEAMLEQVRRNVRECGQGIREREGTYDLEGEIYKGAEARGQALSYTDELLRKVDIQPQSWNADEIVGRLNYAIELLNNAHIAVTRFRERVAATPTKP
jgi:hypothetical protein